MLVVLAAGALGLGGCGRKGPLQLPPNAAQNAAGEPIQSEVDTRNSAAASQGVLFGNADEPPPVAPRGNRKKFILDPILD